MIQLYDFNNINNRLTSKENCVYNRKGKARSTAGWYTVFLLKHSSLVKPVLFQQKKAWKQCLALMQGQSGTKFTGWKESAR